MSSSRVRLFMIPPTGAHQAPLSMDSLGKNTRVRCHSLLQGIFTTQGRQVLYRCATREARFTLLERKGKGWGAPSSSPGDGGGSCLQFTWALALLEVPSPRGAGGTPPAPVLLLMGRGCSQCPHGACPLGVCPGAGEGPPSSLSQVWFFTRLIY